MTPDQALQTLVSESQERGEYDMTEREAFESWAGKYFTVSLSQYGYCDSRTNSAWLAWEERAAQAPAFCPRCGKRNSADLIHTCTPPGE